MLLPFFASTRRQRLALTTFVALIVATLWGCATGTPSEDDSSGGQSATSTGSGSLPGYTRSLEIGAEAPAGYALSIAFDHGSLVADDKAQADGSDLRIHFDDGEEVVEIDRVLDVFSSWNSSKTKLWFKSQGPGEYTLSYGESKEEPVLADPTKVFIYDSAADVAGWTVSEIGNGSNGTYEAKGGILSVSGTSGDIGSTSDNLVFLHRELSPWQNGSAAKSDYIVDVRIKSVEGSLGGEAKMGGIMVRQSIAAEARMAMLSVRQTPLARVSLKREQDGGSATPTELPLAGMTADAFPQIMRLRIHSGTANLSYSDDGETYIQLGDVAVLNLTVPFVVGVPLANISGGTAKAEVDLFRVRPLLVPEPEVTLGEENK